VAREKVHNSEVVDAITATHRTILRETEELLSKEGMTKAQFLALLCVAEKGPIPMKRISEKMSVTRANVTGLIDKLESKGFVKRTEQDLDRRTTIIELTPKGRAVQDRLSSKYKEFMHNSLSALSEDEKETLRRVLTKVQEGMSKSVS
jgi:DNA-binding MarR family transcriptional regulator